MSPVHRRAAPRLLPAMMHPRRLLDLAVLAVLGLGPALGHAVADPAPRAVTDEDNLVYIQLNAGDHITMMGDERNLARARKLQHGSEPMAWFKDGGQDYVLRDAEALRQLEAIWKPVRELGDAQGKLGEQMGALGREQGKIGMRQGLLGTRQGTLAVREQALDLRAANEALTAGERAELTRQRNALRDQQKQLDKEMRALDRPMRELGEQMKPLSEKMDVLGKQMDVVSHKAMADLRASLRRAVATGAAKPANL